MHAARRSRLVLAIACCLIASAFVFLPSALGDSTSSNAYAQLVQGDSPLAYWRLNGGASASTVDATGNGHTLQWVDPRGDGRTPTLGARAIPALQPDTAVQFNGADSAPYGKVQNDGSLNPETFSVEAWVRPMDYLPPSGSDGNTREAIISSYSGCEPPGDSSNCELRGYQLYISNYKDWGDHPQFAFSTGNDTATGTSNKNWVVDRQTTVKKDTWYHVVATATPRSDGNAEMHLYVNGENVANCPKDGTDTCPRSGTFDPSNSDKPTFLGLGTRQDVKTYRLNGEMDELAVYDHVLTADQVLAHYNAGTYSAQPTLTLSKLVSTSPFTGKSKTFRVSVGGISDATGAELTATVAGVNPRTISPIDINGTTATFSYKGTNPGKDTVQVSGTIADQLVSSNSVNVFWLAGTNALGRSFGLPGKSRYAKSAKRTWADPVNSSTGDFYQSVTDVSLPGNGIPFSLDRTYNSRDKTVGVIGKGWSASVYTSLTTDEDGNATLKAGDGQEIGFALQEDGSYVADKDVTASLVKTSSGYDLKLHDQETQHFDSDGRLVSWLDQNGQGFRFAYSSGLLSSVTDAGGREIGFVYNGQGRLAQVTLPGSTTLAYGYDGDLLTSFTDQTGAVTTYAYDGNGYLKSVTDPDGKLVFENTYDGEGRVLTQKDALGAESIFDWSSNTATDANNKAWQDTYNDDGQISARTDPLGNVAHSVYDDANNLLSVTDPLGNKTTMTYDGRGNMLTRTDALENTESWTYDADNNVTSHTDQLGHVTRDTYDANGNLLTETDPTGAVTTNEYDSAGRLIKTADPLGRATRSVYDSEGNLVETISPSGARTTYAYDSLGRQVAQTDPLGNTTTSVYDATGRLIKTTDPLGHTTTSTYDATGRLVAKTDANGNTTHYHYDDVGRQVEVVAPDGSSTHSAYDSVDNLVSSTDALGNVTRSEFDAAGRQTATISPSGARTTTSYDANGNQVASTDPLGRKTETAYDVLGRQVSSTDPLGRTTKTLYDATGNVVKKIDPLGNTTTSTYDAAGRVIKQTDARGNFTTSTYDAAGQLTAETDANGNTTHHAYNDDGQEISVTSPTGAVSTSSYNAAGNLIQSTDANGHATTYAYDAAGNKTSETNPLGAPTTHVYDAAGNEISSKDPLGHTTTTAYNSMNRQISTADPLGRTTKTAYDLNGNVVRATDPLENVTTSDYDAEGRLVKETDPLGHETTSIYDAAGQLTSTTDANGHTTHYAYNAAGEKVSVTAPGDSVTTYDYNAVGNVVKRTDANEHVTTYSFDAAGNKISKTNALGSTWTYSYDAGGNLLQTKTPSGGTINQSYDSENRLTSKTYSDGTPAVSYSYDPAGNKVSMTDGTGTTRYSYDEADRRVSASSASGTFLCSHDEAGNLLSRSYPNGLKTSYGYNDADEMVAATVKGETTRYSYDANSKLATTLHSNGILDTRSYDAAGRLTEISAKTSAEAPFYSRSYTYDPVGNPLSLTAFTSGKNLIGWSKGETLGSWQETYSYDSKDRLTKACMDASCAHFSKYSYDQVGNRLSETTEKATTLYTYDVADELVTETEDQDEITSYAYDLNGNETKAGDTHYAYNLENKLLSAKGAGKPVSYTYTGDGLMASRSTPSESTSYSWDTSSDLSELALETSSKGKKNDTRAYTYGAGPIGIATSQGSYSYHTDSLGSVVELSDSSARSLESYRYAAFGDAYAPGNSDQSNGNFANPIRFTGQYLDTVSDLYNMRAREYEPETGRFLQVDPIEAGAGDSYTGSYVYVEDRPTVMTDPSGERAMRSAVSSGPLPGGEPEPLPELTRKCLRKFYNPFKCRALRDLGTLARVVAEEWNKGKAWDKLEPRCGFHHYYAFRHCIWNAFMDVEWGFDTATWTSTTYEFAPGGNNTWTEHAMGMHNNMVGIIVGRRFGEGSGGWINHFGDITRACYRESLPSWKQNGRTGLLWMNAARKTSKGYVANRNALFDANGRLVAHPSIKN
jgi:RHS repeat-associated protein